MENYKIIMQNLEYLGGKYCERYLSFLNVKDLESNWWKALEFFFSHSFMRGRSDELSEKYLSFTLNVLRKFLKIGNVSLGKSYKMLKDNLIV